MASPGGLLVAQAALAAVPCSSRGPDSSAVDRYAALIIRPSEPRTTAAKAYYLANPDLSTCALTVLACWRVAGLVAPEVLAPYYPARIGRAFTDVEAVGIRCGAWSTRLAAPMLAGDAWIITDADGTNGHMGLCVEDQTLLIGPLKTVEGGQFDGKGSTAIGAFTRTLVQELGTGRWMMGQRYILGVVRAAALPFPTPQVVDPNVGTAGLPAAGFTSVKNT